MDVVRQCPALRLLSPCLRASQPPPAHPLRLATRPCLCSRARMVDSCDWLTDWVMHLAQLERAEGYSRVTLLDCFSCWAMHGTYQHITSAEDMVPVGERIRFWFWLARILLADRLWV